MEIKIKVKNSEDLIFQNEEEVISYLVNEVDGGNNPEVVKFVRSLYDYMSDKYERKVKSYNNLMKLSDEKDEIINDYREIYESSSVVVSKKKKRKGRSIFGETDSYDDEQDSMVEEVFDEYDSNNDFESDF